MTHAEFAQPLEDALDSIVLVRLEPFEHAQSGDGQTSVGSAGLGGTQRVSLRAVGSWRMPA